MSTENCEVCDEPIAEDEALIGCERCAKMFGDCCNSDVDEHCCECAIFADDD